jgi:hypothetical protein
MLGSKNISKSFLGNKNTSNHHFGRRASNTINKFNNVAIPALGLASVIQPQFAPLLGTVGATLKAGQAISNTFR